MEINLEMCTITTALWANRFLPRMRHSICQW